MYSEQDLRWLRCIRDMIHDEGLTVTAIRRLLDLVPCWQIRHCADSIALECAPHQNVPDMARQAPVPREPGAAQPAPSAREDGSVSELEIKLIYGVEELGAVMHCSRCISAERTARRVALRFPGKVTVGKYSIRSQEAQRLGVIQSPTVILGDEVISCGKGMSEDGLAKAVEQRLVSLADANP